MKKILLITTSQEQRNDNEYDTTRIEELTTSYYFFLRKNFSISIATPQGGPLLLETRIKSDATPSYQRFSMDKQALKDLENSEKIADINPQGFNAVFIFGGHGLLWDIAYNDKVRCLIEEFNQSAKPIGAVGLGVAGLLGVKAKDGLPLVDRKIITAFSNEEESKIGNLETIPFLLESRLKQEGGIYSRISAFKPHMQIDENLITGQNTASANLVAEGIAMLLEKKVN